MANACNVILQPHLRQRLRGKTSRFTLPLGLPMTAKHYRTIVTEHGVVN